ncbi:MAG: NAD(P)(+) transhydrogenase (Re/Si-specific) subunit beta, partial [Acholeplasmataceae bacterium]|nr:NAD(P)(+) transhydrogenase (Re/Si-specific) subunit beta [Acholeplasmataceae bacterium]
MTILVSLSSTNYYIVSGILVALVLLGIYLMSKVKFARLGNIISGFAVLGAIINTLIYYDIIDIWALYIYMTIGALIGTILALKIKMISMPQMIAILNGLGGLASMIVSGFAVKDSNALLDIFPYITAYLGFFIGLVTFVGSIIAGLKLQRVLPQKPIHFNGYQVILTITLAVFAASLFVPLFSYVNPWIILGAGLIIGTLFAIVFTMKIGGADMPIVISLLNSFSGVAGALSGLAILDPLLVSVGAVVGASGLLLTQIMCKAMNRSLLDILLGKTSMNSSSQPKEIVEYINEEAIIKDTRNPIDILKEAKSVIIVPGYGMAIAQAQALVKELQDYFTSNGASVKYAIHPVAGRMPGHMNVLLAEVDVDYDLLFEMDDINDDFKTTDAVLVIGANDVLNPTARTNPDTPIYGMPILNVDESKDIFIFNYDLNPGYSGVQNPIYNRKSGLHLFLGNAKDTLDKLMKELK